MLKNSRDRFHEIEKRLDKVEYHTEEMYNDWYPIRYVLNSLPKMREVLGLVLDHLNLKIEEEKAILARTILVKRESKKK